MLFDELIWSSNRDGNDGSFHSWKGVVVMGSCSLESKSRQDNVPTSQLIHTMTISVQNIHLITIMITTKFGTIREGNQAFNNATIENNDVIVLIEGNACASHVVATELRWNNLNVEESLQGDVPGRTIIIIDLESIYFERYKRIEKVYHSS